MAKPGILISTITWARDAREEAVLRESLNYLAALQIPVFICDGGSGSGFLNFLQSFPHFTLVQQTGRGVWEQARSSLIAAHASGCGYIFYTEPDKQEFFRKSLPGFLSSVPGHKDPGVILASRSKSSFAMFPAFQQGTESTINNCCFEIIGREIDYTYGPFLLNSALVPYLQLVREDIGWGWRPYTFGIASRLRYDISIFEGDFDCPPDQREDSPRERIYRMRQLIQNIQGLVLSTSIDM